MKKYNAAPNKKRIYAFLIDCFLPVKWILLTAVIYALFNLVIQFLGFSNYNAVFEASAYTVEAAQSSGYATDFGVMFSSIFNIIMLLASIASFIWMFVILVKQIIQITETGQTLGKKRMNLQIIDLRTNEPIKFGRYFLSRPLTSIIFGLFGGTESILPTLLSLIDCSFILFDKEHRALHDKIWKTLVIELYD